jgi:hypothetical protein
VSADRRLLGVLALFSLSLLLLAPGSATAYVGPGAGLELVPHFWTLTAIAAVAVCAVLLWPITALIRWLRAAKPGRPEESVSEAQTTDAEATTGDGDPASP